MNIDLLLERQAEDFTGTNRIAIRALLQKYANGTIVSPDLSKLRRIYHHKTKLIRFVEW